MNLDPVLTSAAEIFDVPKACLMGVGRTRHLAEPRFAFYAIVRTKLGASLPEIGHAVNRDHTSVMHGLKRAEDLMTRSKAFRERAERLAEAVDQHIAACHATAQERRARIVRRVRRHVWKSLERLAVENPAGFDKLILIAGSYDPTHHH